MLSKNQELCLFLPFLSVGEPALIAFVPASISCCTCPTEGLESTGSQDLPNLVCHSAYGWVAGEIPVESCLALVIWKTQKGKDWHCRTESLVG